MLHKIVKHIVEILLMVKLKVLDKCNLLIVLIHILYSMEHLEKVYFMEKDVFYQIKVEKV